MYKGKILISNYTLVNDLEFNKAVILIVKNDNDLDIPIAKFYNENKKYQIYNKER